MDSHKQNYSSVDCAGVLKDNELSGDWFEDAESEAEWANSISDCNSVAESLGGDLNPQLTLLEELHEKNKLLEQQCREAEHKYKNLQVENEKLHIQLCNERHRANKFQKKLQYIQDNHEIFNRLKKAYLSMKYNESTGRSMVEIEEKGIQTWDGMLCSACAETAEFKRQMELGNFCSVNNNESPMVTVKRSDLLRLQETIELMKELIAKREESWSFNMNRENRYKSNILILEKEVKLFKDLLKIDPMSAKVAEEQPQSPLKDCGFLKKVIVKLEKKQRDIERFYKVGNVHSTLNDKEKAAIEHIVAKYQSKMDQKLKPNKRTMSCDRFTSQKKRPITSPRLCIRSDDKFLPMKPIRSEKIAEEKVGGGEGTSSPS